MGSRTWHWPGVLLGLLLATAGAQADTCLLYTSPSPRDYAAPRMPSSA
ncbi:hypothetical protein KZ847_33565 [Pseudomonas aeruginosa]|nr:hypothetical protein [Pseudomonas aeruginosa]